jgi:hypothetical protein
VIRQTAAHRDPGQDILNLVLPQMIAPNVVEAEEQVIHAVIHLLQADIILIQGLADKHLFVQHPNRAAAADPANQVVLWVGIGAKPARQHPLRGLVHFRRPLHAQRFVRALLVELLPEAIELTLLGP